MVKSLLIGSCLAIAAGLSGCGPRIIIQDPAVHAAATAGLQPVAKEPVSNAYVGRQAHRGGRGSGYHAPVRRGTPLFHANANCAQNCSRPLFIPGGQNTSQNGAQPLFVRDCRTYPARCQ